MSWFWISPTAKSNHWSIVNYLLLCDIPGHFASDKQKQYNADILATKEDKVGTEETHNSCIVDYVARVFYFKM